MKFMELMAKKQANIKENKIPTIAFLGDSVTHGCFDIYRTGEKSLETYYDREHAYHRDLDRIFGILFPSVPVTVVNGGISGDNSVGGVKRLERDILSYKPDLTVVSYGLNDCLALGMNRIDEYADNLRQIFTALRQSGSEVIFMTQNMMAPKVSPHVTDPWFRDMTEIYGKAQINGTLKTFYERAKEVAAECDARVCDVYAKWELMAQNGVDVAELLSNHINHPTKELYWLFAIELMNTILS